HLSDDAFNNKETDKGIKYLGQIQPDKLLNSFQYINFGIINTYSFELVGKAIANLTVNNRFDLAYTFLNVFKKEVNRSTLYAFASQLVSINKQSPDIARRLLDSAQTEMNRLDNPAVFQPNRKEVAIAMMYMNPNKNSNEAYRTIKNSPGKFDAMVFFSKAHALSENLYKAQQQAPPLISTSDKANFLYFILDGFKLTKLQKKEWMKFSDNQPFFNQRYLEYVDEN
ncbi:MAG TPA: hypothetical protein VET23_07410, partial [Chitinophagaceae bacterium]|nr:hypothetical protein [Chitinophagaceae bacterium]